MKHLIVGNWKLNPVTQKEAKQLFAGVKKAKSKNADVVICPPFVYLHLAPRITIGAQNISCEEKGAFTGEVSALQLRDLKIGYTIVGHSERRKYFNETDDSVNKKLKKALDAGLTPIFCIGENAGEDKSQVLEKQLTEGLKGFSRDQVKKIVIAYEPVWAIGTGNNCSVDQTLSSVLFIRKTISQLCSREIADHLHVLYGGSVNSKNSASYLKEAGVNGLLVGGASLNAQEFIDIVKTAN